MSSEAAAFREKPDRATAEAYLASGEYLWNSGMFVWRAQTVLDALADHLPETAEGLRAIVAAAPGPERDAVLAEVFPTLPKISVDYAVLEPAADPARPGPGRRPRRRLAGRRLVAGARAHPRRRRRGQRRPRARPSSSTARATSCSATTRRTSWRWSGVRDSVVVHTADVTMVCPVADAERVKQLLAAVEERHGLRYS